MEAADGARAPRRSDELRVDMALANVLAEEPITLLNVPTDPSEIRRLLDSLRRDQSTPREIRKLLSTSIPGHLHGLPQILVEESAAHERPLDLVLTLLTRPRRVVHLPDGSLWLLTVLAADTASQDESCDQHIAWIRLRLPKSPDMRLERFITELDIYPLPARLDAVRDELILIALQTRWKPPTSPAERVLIVLGPAAATYLGSDIGELEARAAVENVHLTALAVPRVPGDRPWTDTRNRALELEGPVVSAVFPDEAGSLRLLDALRAGRGDRRVTSLPSPGPGGWVLATMLDQLQSAGILPADSLPQTAPQPSATIPAAFHFEARDVYLAKTGSAPGFDILEETGRRCPHRTWTHIQARKAPKKHKGVLRYLGKLSPPGELVKAELCTYNKCGLVRVNYEVAVSAAAEDRKADKLDVPPPHVAAGRGPP